MIKQWHKVLLECHDTDPSNYRETHKLLLGVMAGKLTQLEVDKIISIVESSAINRLDTLEHQEMTDDLQDILSK